MIAFSRRHAVAALGIGAVVLRVAFFAVPELSDSLPRKMYSRSVSFAVAAEALLAGRGGQLDASRVSEVFRAWSASGARLPPPPAGVPATAPAAWIDLAEEKGYVLLHAGWALARGEVGWSGVLLLQALLSGLCVLLVGTAGGWVVDERYALLAAAVYALHPLEIWASVTPDLPAWAVYSAVAACVVALTPAGNRGAGPYARSMLLGGLVMFCAVVRSTNLAFLAAASLILWVRTGRRAWRHQVAFWVAAAAVLAVCAAAPPKTPAVGRSVMYHNLLGGLGEFGDIEGLRWDDRAIRSYLLERYGVTSHTPEYEEAAKRAYEEALRADPSLPLEVAAKRLAWLAAGYRAGRSPWTLVVPLLVLKLAVLGGLWAWWRKRRSTGDVVSFVAVALMPVAVHVLVVPLLAVYLVPTIVLLSIPAAGGVFGMLAGRARIARYDPGEPPAAVSHWRAPEMSDTADPRTFDVAEAIAVLERTPAVLRAWLSGLPAGWIAADEGPDTWSPFDIVGHLVHGERTDWIPRLRIILEHGEGRAFDPFDRFAQFELGRGRTLDELLDELAELRRANLETLRGLELSPQDLARPGRHPELGGVTLGELLATWAVHDLGHVAQIARVMAKRYGSEVGAWRAYLPVLGDRVEPAGEGP